ERGDEFFKAPGVEHIFQARLGAIGAIAMIDKDPHHGVGHRRCLRRLDDHAGIAGKGAMTGHTAEHQPKPNARLNAVTVLYRDSLKSDVVSVLEHRDHTAAIETDIEF